MYYLCWSDSKYITNRMKFDSLNEIIKTISCFKYNGEWVEDAEGNKVNIDLHK